MNENKYKFIESVKVSPVTLNPETFNPRRSVDLRVSFEYEGSNASVAELKTLQAQHLQELILELAMVLAPISAGLPEAKND